jgi:hypothetical protein
LACTLLGWIGHCGGKHTGKCAGCGPKFTPGWKTRPCEPCNRHGDWTGPSIYRGKPYTGVPRSGSNLGVEVEFAAGEPTEAMPKKLQPKATILPDYSVKRSSYSAPQMPRHRRAAPQTARRVVRVQTSPARTSATPIRGVVIE